MHSFHDRIIPITLSAFCIVAFPAAVSAASLTVTQQGLVSASAPLGAQRALFLEVSLQTSCDGPVKVQSLGILHRGLGDVADLERIYVTDGVDRLSNAQSFHASGSPTDVRFSPPLLIPPCTVRSLQLRGDFSASATVGGQHGLVIERVDAGDSTVMLSAASNTHVLTTRPVSDGTINATLLGLTRQPRFGVSSTLARIRLEADGYKDQEVHAITFLNKGKAQNADVRNLRIQTRRGEVLTATLAGLDAKRARLIFTEPLSLKRNSNIVLELVGEFRASKSRTVSFVIEEPSDVEGTSLAR